MSEIQKQKIRPKEREAIIQSLRAGVTPRTGLSHIQVGRLREVEAIIKDIERICNGGTAFRLIIGDFGSGKSFFLHLIRTIALKEELVTLHADLSPDRRLAATGGQARNLCAELMRNLATRANPEGGALPSIVERFITEARKDAKDGKTVDAVIKERLNQLTEFVNGFDFANVVAAYWKGHESDNEQLQSDAIRWLRGEYTTKTDARKTLDVRAIVDDAGIYEHIKLMSLFVRLAGYKGLLVNLDEMVNLYKLASQKSRISNYERILGMLNDCLQGNVESLGFLLAGTPDFLENERKGLFSYEALRSRLAENSIAKEKGIVDYSSPVLRLANLTREEIFVLLKNLRHVFAFGDPAKYLLPDEALTAFLEHCSQRLGSTFFQTPRNTIKAFVDLLALLDQNKSLRWDELITNVQIAKENNTDLGPDIVDDDSDLANFKL